MMSAGDGRRYATYRPSALDRALRPVRALAGRLFRRPADDAHPPAWARIPGSDLLYTEVDDAGRLHLKGPGVDYVNDAPDLAGDAAREWLLTVAPQAGREALDHDGRPAGEA